MSIHRAAWAAICTITAVLAALLTAPAHALNPPVGTFVTVWNTANPGASSQTQIRLPLVSDGDYGFTVDWGDASTPDTITSWNQPERTHTYATAGTYTVSITGKFIGWRFGGGDALKLVNVAAWGGLQLGNSGAYFKGAANMNATARDTLNLTGTTNLSEAFSGATHFNGAVGTWNTSAVTDMDHMFYGATDFNQDIGGWNVGQVTDMSWMFGNASSFNQNIGTWTTTSVTTMHGMFQGAAAFNQPIGAWTTDNVTDMAAMFDGASAFNQPLGMWNTDDVTTMRAMFNNASAFNQPIGAWNTTKVNSTAGMFSGAATFNQDIGAWNVGQVTDMYGMFWGATAFDHSLNGWNVGSVTDMARMFDGAAAFDQPLGAWNTGNVADMNRMFSGASTFNQPIGGWNVAYVTDMSNMFNGADAFNQPIGGWNVANVTTMGSMFADATAFNQPLGSWNTGKVTDMSSMFFDATSFNQPLGGWNVAAVTDMNAMFWGASDFDQNVGAWNVGNVADMASMFLYVTLSIPNYDGLLNGWSGLDVLQRGVTFDAGSSMYSSAGAPGRAILINGHGWTIDDGGLAAPGFAAAPNPLAFGEQQVGTVSGALTVNVANPGKAPLVLPAGAVTVADDPAGQFVLGQDTCSGHSLQPATKCTVKVQFQPTSTGPQTARLLFTSNVAGSPRVVSLTGNGVSPAPIPSKTTTPTPAPQPQTLKPPAKKVKVKKRATLPKTTNQGAPVSWKAATKKTCTVKAGKVKGVRKGTCRLTATAPAITGYLPLSTTAKIKIT